MCGQYDYSMWIIMNYYTDLYYYNVLKSGYTVDYINPLPVIYDIIMTCVNC